MNLIRDYETRSCVDLPTTGAQKYAMHPSTEAICLGIKIIGDSMNGTQVFIWVNPYFEQLLPPGHGLPLVSTQWLIQEMSILPLNDNFYTESHNDGFEQAIDEHIMLPRFNVPAIRIEQRRCSSMQAAINALPRNLDKLGAALDLPEYLQKDKDGHDLMLKMCKPATMYAKDWRKLDNLYSANPVYQAARMAYKKAKSDKGKHYTAFIAEAWYDFEHYGIDPRTLVKWHEDPQDVLRLCQYCIQDLEAEHAVGLNMPGMNQDDMNLWILDQRINRRGVYIDVQGARAAIAMVKDYLKHNERMLADVTNGAVKTVGQHAALQGWCAGRGIQLPNTAKDTLEYYLKKVPMPPDVHRAIQIRVDCGMTSVTKYEAMIRAACPDQRVRGVFKAAAAATGRWAALLVQLHNMPRGTVKLKTDEDIDFAFRTMSLGWREAMCLFGNPMGLAASAVRGAITAAPESELVVSDFKSVEARKVLWLAGDWDGLEVFRQGRDVYRVAAAGIFGRTYDEIKDPSDERQVGKVGTLSLGFGGGIGAYGSMARNYSIDLETLPPLVLPTATPYELKAAQGTAEMYLDNLEKRIKLKLEKNIGKASFLDRMSIEAAMSCDIIKQRWRRDHQRVKDFWDELENAALGAVMYPGTVTAAGPFIKFSMSDCRRFLLMWLPSGRALRYYKPVVMTRKKFGQPRLVLTFLRTVEGAWVRTETYGGKLCENAVQASSNDLLRYSMFNVEANGFPIVIHVHDEAGAEILRGSRTLEEYNYLMAMAPSWADGLPMGADGWIGRRFKK